VGLAVAAPVAIAGQQSTTIGTGAKTCVLKPGTDCRGVVHRWTVEHHGNLRKAKFTSADLRGADFRGADLRGADFRGAKLRHADLRGANLKGARLDVVKHAGKGANGSPALSCFPNCQGADLRFASLIDANLTGATLSYANLSEAGLRGASLNGANLTGAIDLAIAADAPQRLLAVAHAALAEPDALEMRWQHTSATAHSICGWAEHLGGPLAALIIKQMGRDVGGLMLLGVAAHAHFDASNEEARAFLRDLGVADSGVSALIRASYQLLGLQTYFTAGEKEVRAWTIKKGWKAPQAAGVIHTDFEQGFIKAEVVSYQDLVTLGSVAAAREAGKYRLEGKEYVFQDGDVALFRFNN
jgi:uncharacterized protein YjbI with pentapeptide repeats